ncbi:MAG TPA: pyridoxamine 5'-phosphate oxidase [Blastocatellia bacterium]|nr:pyridoxamine 5'-phosphate oxidase [Blastocatellia bacterium]
MAELNRDYSQPPLRKSDVDPNPLVEFQKWFNRAIEVVPILPNAMTLATATRDGVPSARTVLLKDYDERGFVFYTNYDSQKAKELEENPVATLLFYWPELERQVRITGRATRTTREESEEYFRTRPRDSQLSAWASRQSEVIASREVLQNKMAELVAEYEGREVPLPPNWGGYRVAAEVIEFWQGRPSRLHDRLRYTRQSDGEWLIERLSP